MKQFYRENNRGLRIIAVLVALAVFCGLSCASAETAQNVTGECAFRISGGKSTRVLTDSDAGTIWKPDNGNGTCYIRLPETGAGYLQVEWKTAPDEGCAVIQYAADQSELTRVQPNGNLVELYPLDAAARYAFIKIAQTGQGICGVRLYSTGDLPDAVQDWELPYEKCDLLVISAHQDDEWLWFGGIIPYYECVMGKRVQVVYMTNCSRARYAEAINGLWTGGLKHFPMFLGLKDERVDSLDQSLKDWGGADRVLNLLTAVIRRFHPEVILTHDWNGEYGHNQHKLTSRAMEYAIEAAANAEQYPDSAAEYGVWQVKKLYRHLETKCPINFDWQVSYPELKNHTPYEVCKAAYDKHKSQHKYFQMEKHGRYDNARFGLSWSAVGEDTLHKDLFENIDGMPAADA